MEYSGAKGCFTISSGVGTSLNELIGILEDVLGKPIVVRYLPSRLFDVPMSVLTNNLVRNELEWVPSISMLGGIVRVAGWMKRELEALDT